MDRSNRAYVPGGRLVDTPPEVKLVVGSPLGLLGLMPTKRTSSCHVILLAGVTGSGMISWHFMTDIVAQRSHQELNLRRLTPTAGLANRCRDHLGCWLQDSGKCRTRTRPLRASCFRDRRGHQCHLTFQTAEGNGIEPSTLP